MAFGHQTAASAGRRRRTTSDEGRRVNKSDLIRAVSESSGLSRGDATKALDGMIDTISDAVQQGEKVSIAGFGTFERRERAARTGRNPQTGEELQVAASKAPAFKAAKAFKDAVNG